jgi:hypothetical protein
MLEVTNVPIYSELYPKDATIYRETDSAPKACILYFHGGGLLYGNRRDLPELHVQKLTQAGYMILSFDYPLAPVTKLPSIMEDVLRSINEYPKLLQTHFGMDLPYFLWGRSSGAYLILLAGASKKLERKPLGLISYYGYGFLCDNWYGTPSKYYRKFPPVPEDCLKSIPPLAHATGDLNTHYSLYVYARQTGKWKELIYEGRDKYFYTDYSLRLCDKFPAPLFCAHSVGDPDVPFSEFTEICNRYNPRRFVAAIDEHDFDRRTEDPFTEKLLDATVSFMDMYADNIPLERRFS